jgi:hypothetical protein
MEQCADEYGYQDYSYQFSSNLITELSVGELHELCAVLTAYCTGDDT